MLNKVVQYIFIYLYIHIFKTLFDVHLFRPFILMAGAAFLFLLLFPYSSRLHHFVFLHSLWILYTNITVTPTQLTKFLKLMIYWNLFSGIALIFRECNCLRIHHYVRWSMWSALHQVQTIRIWVDYFSS